MVLLLLLFTFYFQFINDIAYFVLCIFGSMEKATTFSEVLLDFDAGIQTFCNNKCNMKRYIKNPHVKPWFIRQIPSIMLLHNVP